MIAVWQPIQSDIICFSASLVDIFGSTDEHRRAQTSTMADAHNAETNKIAEEKAAVQTVPLDSPLGKLYAELPDLVKEAGHSEIYGIDVSAGTELQKYNISQKFLRANANDVDKAKAQLLDTLKWRRSFEPLKTKEEVFSKTRFGGLGYVTEVTGVPGSQNPKDVVTFNIYGAVKDNKATFGDINAFMRWRVAVMEMSVEALDLANAKTMIPNYNEGADPYQGFQIHDYLGVSFFRQDPDQKAAAKAAIDTFSKYYPETLSRKFFVNVNPIMSKFLPLSECGIS